MFQVTQQNQSTHKAVINSPINSFEHDNRSKETVDRSSSLPFNFSDFSIQPKLEINKPGDRYEKEADKIASIVVNSPQSATVEQEKAKGIHQKQVIGEISPVQQRITQRKCSKCEEEEEEMVQRKESHTANPTTAHQSFSQKLHQTPSKGRPLDGSTNQFMSTRFGIDFSNVRIHDNRNAAELSTNIGARAFTRGNDIYFNEGEYNPASKQGRELLAHELVHTVQQGDNRHHIQRDLAVEVQNPEAEIPELTEEQIAEAIEFNERRIRRDEEVALIRDVIGLSPEPAVIDHDFVRFVAWYQAIHAIGVDGKIGAETASRFSQEFRREGRSLPRTESRDLRRFARTMGTRAVTIRPNVPAATNDNRGSATFGVIWNISDNRANGYVIQHVRFTGNITNCANNNVASNNAAAPNNYWEAWRVINGRVQCGNLAGPCTNSDDTFTTATEPANTKGTVGVQGRVSFFPDYTLDSNWVTTAPGAHPAGQLPHRADQPPEWRESSARRHIMTVTYDDCATPSVSNVTSTP